MSTSQFASHLSTAIEPVISIEWIFKFILDEKKQKGEAMHHTSYIHLPLNTQQLALAVENAL